MAKLDRQQARLRTLAVSHLNIAASYLDQAKGLIKSGQGGPAIAYMQKALGSIEGAHDAIPAADCDPTPHAALAMTLDEVTAAEQRAKQTQTAPEPVAAGVDQP